MKDLYTGNYKRLLQEEKTMSVGGRTSHVHGWEDNIKVTVPPKVTCRFNGILIEIPKPFSLEMKKPILKIIWNWQGPRRE